MGSLLQGREKVVNNQHVSNQEYFSWFYVLLFIFFYQQGTFVGNEKKAY